MKWIIAVISLLAGAAVELYIMGDDWARLDVYVNAGRLIGGTIGFGLIIWFALSLARVLFNKLRRMAG
jgi:hypothetical protein